MPINRGTTLFFDASVLVAGSHSSTGGSALLLDACRHGGFTAQTTFAILVETLRTLQVGFPQETLSRFYEYLTAIRWDLLPVPTAEVMARYEGHLEDPDDVHVLAAPAEARSQFLITLDSHHILVARHRVREAGIALTILRPGEFIQEYYPQHEEFPSLPQPRRPAR